jgi:hypothetical protein
MSNEIAVEMSLSVCKEKVQRRQNMVLSIFTTAKLDFQMRDAIHNSRG